MKIELTNDLIHVVENFLQKDDYEKIVELSSNYSFKPNHKSSPLADPHGHWFYNLLINNLENNSESIKDVFSEIKDNFYKKIWNYIQEKYQFDNKILVRCYMNAYTYGTEGYAHTDSNRDNEWTIVLYVMKDNWDINWAGETVLFMNNDVFKSVLPKKNRAFIFPSKMTHAARSVSRICYQTRKTLMFKFRSKYKEEM